MTVKELIDELLSMPMDAEVDVHFADDFQWVDLNEEQEFKLDEVESGLSSFSGRVHLMLRKDD